MTISRVRRIALAHERVKLAGDLVRSMPIDDDRWLAALQEFTDALEARRKVEQEPTKRRPRREG